MARADPPGDAEQPRSALTDAEGRRTDDPGSAVAGEIVEYGRHERHPRRTRFFLERGELRWLPIGEAAFLLWVLAVLLVIWASIGLVLRFA
jgi:hypothetical protein